MVLNSSFPEDPQLRQAFQPRPIDGQADKVAAWFTTLSPEMQRYVAAMTTQSTAEIGGAIMPEYAYHAARLPLEQQVTILRGTVETLTRTIARLEERVGPCVCDHNPETTDGPDEFCPQHGRPYTEVVEMLGELAEQSRAGVSALQVLHQQETDALAQRLRQVGTVLRKAVDSTHHAREGGLALRLLDLALEPILDEPSPPPQPSTEIRVGGFVGTVNPDQVLHATGAPGAGGSAGEMPF